MKQFLFFISLTLVWIACSDPSGVEREKPAKPSMVKRSLTTDIDSIERGIDAADDSETDDIVIMWHKHPATLNLDKYVLYRGQDINGQLIYEPLPIVLKANTKNDTVTVDTKLELGVLYHYYIIAIDQNNTKSLPSDTVQYKLIDKAWALDVDADTANGFTNPERLTFSASYVDGQTGPGKYAIRIRGEDDNNLSGYRIVYQTEIKNVDFNGFIKEEISGEDLKVVFDKGGLYQWRVDLFQGENTGSETIWQDFPELIIWGD
jgi:hypothetical protein